MSGGIDPVSQALGRLLADADTRQRQSAELFRLVKETSDGVAELAKSMAVSVSNQEAHAVADERRFLDHEHERRNDRLAMTMLASKVSGMELTTAKKAGNAAAVGAWSTLVSAVTAAVMKVWE